MYIVKNIANDRFKGALFRRDRHFGATMQPLALRLEPWIGDRQIKLDGQIMITDDEFKSCQDVIQTHIAGNVIEIVKVDNPIEITVDSPLEVSSITQVIPEPKRILDEVPEVQIVIDDRQKQDVKNKKKRD